MPQGALDLPVSVSWALQSHSAWELRLPGQGLALLGALELAPGAWTHLPNGQQSRSRAPCWAGRGGAGAWGWSCTRSRAMAQGQGQRQGWQSRPEHSLELVSTLSPTQMYRKPRRGTGRQRSVARSEPSTWVRSGSGW